MPEFNASQARNFYNNRDKLGAERWYAYFKEDLFKHILEQSLNGECSFNLESHHWEDNDFKKNYLVEKLSSMHYQVQFRDSGYLKNTLCISW